MKVRLFAALALVAGTVALSAQEPNPYAKAKVGDFAVFKTVTKVAGIPVEGQVTQTVIGIDAKEATIRVNTKVNNQEFQPVEFKVDVTKPFDPTQASGPLPEGVGMTAEKVQEKERTEKVKVGTGTHDAKVETYKVKVKAGGTDFESRVRVWLVPTLQYPIAKMELTATVDQQPVEVTQELLETGNKPVEKKEPDKKDAPAPGPKDGKK